MTLVVDTVGKITLPTGEECHGVILTGEKSEVMAARLLWAERVTIAKYVEPSDDAEVERSRMMK